MQYKKKSIIILYWILNSMMQILYERSRITSHYFWTKFKRSTTKIKNSLPLLLNQIFKIHPYGFFNDIVLPPFPFPNLLAKGINSTKILPPGPSGSPLSSQIFRVSSSVSLKKEEEKHIFIKMTLNKLSLL